MHAAVEIDRDAEMRAERLTDRTARASSTPSTFACAVDVLQFPRSPFILMAEKPRAATALRAMRAVSAGRSPPIQE